MLNKYYRMMIFTNPVKMFSQYINSTKFIFSLPSLLFSIFSLRCPCLMEPLATGRFVLHHRYPSRFIPLAGKMSESLRDAKDAKRS